MWHHVHMIYTCTYTAIVHTRSTCINIHLQCMRTTERNASHARGAPSSAAQCTILRCRMRTTAHRARCVKVVHVWYVRSQFYLVVHVRYVRRQFYFQFYFLSRVTQSTVVASQKRADVFVSDKGVTVGNSVSNHVQAAPTSPLGEARAPFETEVSATTFRFRNSTVGQS